MNALESLALMAVGGWILYVVLDALLRLESRLMERVRRHDARTIDATKASQRRGTERREPGDAHALPVKTDLDRP